jgi:hypothetical protein
VSPRPPRPKQASRPEIVDLTPETPVREGRRFDNPHPIEPLPPPPNLPGGLSPTLPSAPLPPPHPVPEGAAAAAARRRASELETRAALAEARAAKAEADAAAARAATVAPASGDVLSDDVVGKLVKAVVSALTKRVGGPLALLAMLGVGGAGYHVATDKPAPPPVTAAELDARLDKFADKIGGRLDKLTTTVNEGIDVTRCVRRKTNQIGESLLPAPDRMGAKRLPTAFEDDCPDGPKRLPETKQ